MANSVDPDQSAPFKEQSDLSLHCWLMHFSLNIYSHYNNSNCKFAFGQLTKFCHET